MPERDQMLKRQRALADFGEFALESDELDQVLTEACRLVGEALGTGRAKILEIKDEGESLFVRAGVGWAPGVVGKLRMRMDERSSETFAIKEGKPIIMRDVREETRFETPDFLKEAGVVALANVPIFLPGRRPYGLLQVDASEPRDFADEDTEFLRTYATILGPVIDRLQKMIALRSTEERFRLVVENARDYAIFTSDPEDRITAWHAGAETVFGWTAEEAVGQPSAIIFTPEDREVGADAQEIETARREGSAPNVRWHLRKDGSRVFIEGMTSALHGADGSLRGFLKIGQDVTERRKADEALRKSEARFRAFVTASADSVYSMGPDWSKMRQLDGRGFLSDTPGPSDTWMEHYIHSDDQPMVRSAIDHAIRSKSMFELEHRVRKADGSLGWTLSRAVPVLDEGGEIAEWLGAATDVTPRKQAETALRESEERFRALASLVPTLLWQSDADGEVISLNQTWLDYSGQTLEQSQNRGWLNTIHPDDRDATAEAFAAGHRTHQVVEVQHRVRRRDGEYRWFLVRQAPMTDSGGRVTQWFGAGTDIHDLQSLQQRQGVMVAELQHRTRNLIGVVRSIAQQTMEQTGPTEAFRTEFNHRLEALSRVQGLLSRSEEEPVTIHGLIRMELDALGVQDGPSDHIVLDGPVVHLRSSLVQTLALALHELTTNARKHGVISTDEGRLSVTWRVREANSEGRHLVLEWVETGAKVPIDTNHERRGYGRELIERALPYALGAKTNYELRGEGARCTIDLPLEKKERRRKAQ